MRQLTLTLPLSVILPLGFTASVLGQVIDTHAHILMPGQERGLNPSVDATPNELRQQMKESGVTMAGIMAMVQKGAPEAMRAHNDYVLELAAASKEFFPIASVHPLDGDVALEEVKRVADLGAKGLKLHPFYQGFDIDDPSVAAVVKAAGEKGLAVVFDSISASDGGSTGKFVDLAIANPDTRIVLAHMSGYRFDEMILFAVFAKGPFYKNNVFFDLSAVAELYADSPRQEELIWTMRQIGMDQFLFASDFPIFNLKQTRDVVDAYGLTQEELRKLYYENALRVFALN